MEEHYLPGWHEQRCERRLVRGDRGVSDYWPVVHDGFAMPVCPAARVFPQGRCDFSAFAGFEGATSCSAPNGGFHEADLRYANLSGCDLSGADLSGADLEQALLTGANLAGANLSGAKLYNVAASGANLGGANLDGAIVSHAQLDGANLTAASTARTMFRPQVKNTICPDGSNSDAPDGDGSTCDNNR